jgi:hypothetical protein
LREKNTCTLKIKKREDLIREKKVKKDEKKRKTLEKY